MRLAIVGGGIMGANHARVASTLRGVVVTHVVDPDADRCAALAASCGATPVDRVEQLLGRVDAAVVAVPTPLHHPIAGQLLDAGIHVLVEKPIACDVAEAEDLIARAAAAGVQLGVGHVERFNPAVLALDAIVERPLHMSASRVSPYSPRITDGVILDLMIHDIEILLHLADVPPSQVGGISMTTRSTTEDLAVVTCRFGESTTGSLMASRIGQQKIRQLEITQDDSFVVVDLLRQDVTIHRVAHSEYLSEAGARYRQTGVVEIPFLEQRGEPLALELADFVEAVRDGRSPRVSGRAGADALDFALRAVAAVG